MRDKKCNLTAGLHLCCAIAALWLLSSPAANALKSYGPNATEMMMLPPYCVARLQDGNRGPYEMWQQRMGRENFDHMHHYCYALNFMNRARFEQNPNDRKHYLTNAIGDFEYVIKRWNPKFQLMPAAKNYRKQAEFMLNR